MSQDVVPPFKNYGGAGTHSRRGVVYLLQPSSIPCGHSRLFDQVFSAAAWAVKPDHEVDRIAHVGDEDPVLVLAGFEQLVLLGFLCFPNRDSTLSIAVLTVSPVLVNPKDPSRARKPPMSSNNLKRSVVPGSNSE